MNPAPLLNAGQAVRLHFFTVAPALLIGVWLILASRKGSCSHRVLGYAFLGLTGFTVVAALFVHQLMPGAPLGLSPVHLLVPLTLWGMAKGWLAARRHEPAIHGRVMRSLLLWSMLVAGAFTLLPGRILHQVVFGP